MFETYNRILQRVYMAEFIDNQRRAQESWLTLASKNGTGIGESAREETRRLLLSGTRLSTPSPF